MFIALVQAEKYHHAGGKIWDLGKDDSRKKHKAKNLVTLSL
jgi:hypothetical protein